MSEKDPGKIVDKRPRNVVRATIREEDLELHKAAARVAGHFGIVGTFETNSRGHPLPKGEISIAIENTSDNTRSFINFWDTLKRLENPQKPS
jgi:hypothetical protein